METGFLAGRRHARALAIGAALLLVLVLVVAGVLIYRAGGDDVWVAQESDFNVCSLVEPQDVRPVLEEFGTQEITDPPTLLAHRLTYVQSTSSFADQCTYGYANGGGGAAVELTVGPATEQTPPTEYGQSDGEDLSELDNSRFYAPYLTNDGVTVTQHGEVRLELAFNLSGSAANADAEAVRGLLGPLTQAVVERVPDGFAMPGDVADGRCHAIADSVAELLDDDPTYSRSFVRNDDNAPNVRAIECHFAHRDDSRIVVTMRSNNARLAEQIDQLTEYDEVETGDNIEVYRDDNFRHYFVGPDERSLVEVRLYQPGVLLEPGQDREPPQGEELERIVQLGEDASRATF